MDSKNKFIDLRESILSDAISAIDIIGVDIKENDQNCGIYIKTSDLKTVNCDKLQEICKKNSTINKHVSFVVPEQKIINEQKIKNSDLVCIFIESF